ncbi:MAG: sensor histidine kinase N-terminal domain-containing protein [Gammaproteobacteria bacterium]|nr:sensor histidine kinase N-terminal domain-containing protein [Gammaproteobacteria bacterium]MBU1447104.1 sensor histidine kinase N-terminal domain-containing protein [Gammaproteobacteria bacterium]
MSRRSMSIQSRLTLLLLGAVLLFGILAGYESHKNALHEADELFDAQLVQFSHSLLSVATDLDDDHAARQLPLAHKYQQNFVFEVWSEDDGERRVLLRSDEAVDLNDMDLPEKRLQNRTWNGSDWRFYHLRDKRRRIEVLVGQNDKVRNELAREVAWHNVTPFLFGLPVLALFILIAIRLGLRPLRRLTSSLLRLQPEQLSAIELGETPAEITPVVTALNNLLTRTAGVIENERRFTADAAHELRTPIAALQSQIQAAQFATSEAERNDCLNKTLQGTERMSHLVGQLLTLSRLDELSAPALLEPLDLAELARACSAELAPLALDKHITLELEAATATPVLASEELLRILLRNLLDNAIRYTPQGGRIGIEIKEHTLTITDSGCGVAGEDLAKLGQRFNRLDRATQDGVGLGLSIVQRIAALHGATMEFGQSSGRSGLKVTVRFPAAR